MRILLARFGQKVSSIKASAKLTKTKFESWVFFSGLFWKTLMLGLGISIVAKFVVNVVIDPISQGPRLSSLKGQIFPFPPGRFAITHAEHWHQGWPDYTDGFIGKISATLGSFIERFVEYDNVELIVYVSIFALIVIYASGKSFNWSKEELKLVYVGMGLIISGGISNQAEIALFNHVTDFIFLRTSGATTGSNRRTKMLSKLNPTAGLREGATWNSYQICSLEMEETSRAAQGKSYHFTTKTLICSKTK